MRARWRRVSKIVGAAFYKNSFKLGSKNGLNARYVFMKKLFLEGDGIGGDNAADIAFEGGEEGGDQVGITFPNTGSGFYGEDGVRWRLATARPFLLLRS